MPSDRVIAGRYRLDERIGSGAMGIVWRATDTELGRVVALKQSQDGDNGQIRREARIGAGLHHPNVVTVFDTVLDGDARWLVMEYLPSRTLAEVMDQIGPVDPVTVARIGAQLANALVAMHELEMVHRDIKPGNVLVAENGTAKLTDLGIARWADVTATGGGQLVGTPAYVAPEVADGREAGPAADVYSLGATLFAAVEGVSPTGSGEQGPFVQMRRASAGELEPMQKAGALEPVLRAMLCKNPAERPPATAAKAMLDEIAGESVPLALMPRRRFGKRKLAITAAVVVLVLVAGLVFALQDWRQTPDPASLPGSLGDQRTADPCALVVIGTGFKFGLIATLDSEYGGFLRCGMLIKQSQNNEDLVDARVEIGLPPENPSQPHVRGQLGPVERLAEKDGTCERRVVLADGYQLTVAARHKKEWPAPLCNIAEAMTTDALAVLSRGPVPRRTEPFPAESLGSVNACELLTREEIAQDTGVGLPPDRFPVEPDVGSWTCWWGKDPVEADIILKRDYPLDSDDGKPIKVAGKDAVVEVQKSGDTGHDACVVDVIHRQYRKDVAWNDTWQDIASLTLETEENISPDQLCAKAIKLAEKMVPRLPKV